MKDVEHPDIERIRQTGEAVYEPPSPTPVSHEWKAQAVTFDEFLNYGSEAE